jgi:hypothetical protein
MSYEPGNERGAGWVLFASMAMIVVGGWHMIQGFAVVIDKADGSGVLLTGHSWGWAQMLLGLLVLLAGVALFAGANWAAGVAAFVVVINAVNQVFAISTYPFWAITMLVLDVFILWAICVYRPPKID